MRRIDEYWVIFNTGREQPGKAERRWGSFYEWIASVKNAIIIIFIIFTFIFRSVGISGSSMNPTLYDDQWVAVSGISFSPSRGDIVVITQPNDLNNEPLIKRVIAVEGDTLDINFSTGEVKVNGEVIHEHYIKDPTMLGSDWIKFPMTVDEGMVFVMGDNRNDSTDSRSSRVKLIDKRYILGKAIIRIFPLGKWSIYD